MTQLADLSPPKLPELRIAVEAPDTVKLVGTITSRDPTADLAPFLKRVHAAAVAEGLRSVNVDVAGLTFVNSSAIRLFVDWTTWAKQEPEASRYQLRFVSNHLVTWQKTTLMALKSLAPNVVTVALAP